MSSLKVVNVYADLHGKPVMVGVLRVMFQRGQERSALFTDIPVDRSFLASISSN